MPDGNINQATWLAIFGAVGGAGVVGKFGEHLFGRRKRKIEEKQTLQEMVDKRLALLLDADDKRLTQMSAAIDDQSAKIDRLDKTVQLLAGHIISLERILKASNIEVPPRPVFAM